MGFFSKKETVEKRDMTIENSGLAADIMYSKLYGSSVDCDTAMQIPSVARCVNMIASAVAMLPVKMYRREGTSVKEITDDPRITMLNSVTGDTISADEMRFSMVRDYLLTGSAFAYIGRSYDTPDKLYYVSEKYVAVQKNLTDIIHKRFQYSILGRIYYPYQMLKVLKNTDGFGKGRGIVQENPLIIDTAYQMMKFQKNQLVKGGNKKGFLKSEKTLAKPAVDEVKAAWAKLYSNENTENIVFLNNGIDFKEVSNSSVEMQINQNMQTANAEIMKLFGTADGILSDATVKNAVMPVIDAFEAAYDNDLLLENERGSVYFAFDTRELTRGDIQQRYSAYAVALQNNFMQLDEVREREDLPPLGVNFIKLGLNDVLLDPKTNQIYTPNTNAMVNIGTGEGANVSQPVDKSGNDDIIEDRARHFKQNPKTGLMEGSYKETDDFTLSPEERRSFLSDKIESNELPLKLREQKQNTHRKGTPQYVEGNSYVTIDNSEIQEIINKRHNTGKVFILNQGKHIREVISCDKTIGVNVDLEKGIEEDTSNATIHYSKKGTHMVPAHGKEKGK